MRRRLFIGLVLGLLASAGMAWAAMMPRVADSQETICPQVITCSESCAPCEPCDDCGDPCCPLCCPCGK